jgi:hypothetical protein
MRGSSWRWIAVAIALASGSGCTLITDFSIKPDAGPSPEACTTLEADPDDLDHPVPIEPGGNLVAICPAGDLDYYQFTVPGANQTVSVTIRNDELKVQDLELTLFYASGALIVRGEGISENAKVIVCPNTNPICDGDTSDGDIDPLPTGDYKLEVKATGPAVDKEYRLELSIN